MRVVNCSRYEWKVKGIQGIFPGTIAWNSNKFASKSPHYPKIELYKQFEFVIECV